MCKVIWGAVPICQTLAPNYYHDEMRQCNNGKITIERICRNVSVLVTRAATANLNSIPTVEGARSIENKEMHSRQKCNNLESYLSSAAFLTLHKCTRLCTAINV